MQSLFRLIYCSRERQSATADSLQALQMIAARNNRRDNITGALLYYRRRFIQVLEGSRADVSACYMRIAADERHCELVLLGFHAISHREFPDWSMRLLPVTPMTKEHLASIFNDLDEGTDRDAADQAVGILKMALTRSRSSTDRGLRGTTDPT